MSSQKQNSRRSDNKAPPKKKESILQLSKYNDQPLLIKFQGNRQVKGILKGFDSLQNLVLDDCVEVKENLEVGRKFGLVVCRGTSMLYIAPADGSAIIENPFVA